MDSIDLDADLREYKCDLQRAQEQAATWRQLAFDVIDDAARYQRLLELIAEHFGEAAYGNDPDEPDLDILPDLVSNLLLRERHFHSTTLALVAEREMKSQRI